MELKKVKENIFYIEDATNIPVIVGKDFHLIVDAGIDKDKAKKIKKILEESHIKPNYLLLSHHHADHTGGARFLKDYFSLKTISSREEKPFMEFPLLEPIYLCQGSSPQEAFLSKWIKAEEVDIDLITNGISLSGVEFIELSGHSIGMVGIKVDSFVFSADSFFSEEILNKYMIPYFHSFNKFLEKMEFLKSLDYDYILPSHGTLLDKEKALKVIEQNIKVVKNIEEKILEITKEPSTLTQIMEKFNLPVHDIVVYTLIESSIKATLNWLIDNKLIVQEIRSSNVYFKRI